MWLEHIHTLIEETNMDHLNCDLPMAKILTLSIPSLRRS